MNNIDKRVYLATAIGAVIVGGGLLLATQPAEVAIIHVANAAANARISQWKGMSGIVMHEGRNAAPARRTTVK